MIRVAALTSGPQVPSARFRVRQHIELLRNLGIEVTEYIPPISKYGTIPGWPRSINPLYGFPLYAIWQGAKLLTRTSGILGSWKNQITWLERQLLPGCFTLEWSLKRPLVFDVDDAIWLVPPFGRLAAKFSAQIADVVIVGNRFLADWFSDYARIIEIVPTAIDTERFAPALRKINSGSRFVMGWTGIGWNLPYLEAIENPLKRLMDQFHDVDLLVIADRPPRLQALPGERVRYLPWSIDNEIEGLQQMHVGLMPLPNSDWARGKCSFKMLQYMACGIPVVVSPVGMNSQILEMGEVGLPATTDQEWYEALEYLYVDREALSRRGQKGRGVVERHFSRRVVSTELAEIFRELN